MKKAVVLLMSILIFILSVTACSQGPKELDEVTMIFPRSVEVLDDAHLHAAVAMGYFEEEGIDVTFETSYGTSDVRMIASGQGDFAYPSPYIQLMAHEEDLPIISVYQVDVRNIFGFSVLPDSDIKTIADLKGKTISLGDPAWTSISDPMLIHAGLDPATDVEYVVAGENRAQMVAEGELDAVLTWEKEYQLWDAQGIALRYMSGEDVLQNCSNSLIVSLDTYKNNKELIVRYLRAVAKGAYFTKLNPRAATEIVLEKFPTIEVEFEDALKAIEALVYIDHNEDTEKFGYGYHNADAWTINVQDALRAGMISEEVPLDQIYTNEFVDEINDFDHEAIEKDAANYQLDPGH